MSSVWSDYASAYSHVMDHASAYRQLVSFALGDEGPLERIPDGVVALDCGAGNGLLTAELVRTRSHASVVAVENNPSMVENFTRRCRDYMDYDGREGRVRIVQADMTDLAPSVLAPTREFDLIFLINVLYVVEDPIHFLSMLRSLLSKNGELRLSGPRLDSDTKALFAGIKRDLESQGLFGTLRDDFEIVRNINMQRLVPMALRWTTADVVDLLSKAGYSEIVHTSEEIYCGQGMFVVVRK